MCLAFNRTAPHSLKARIVIVLDTTLGGYLHKFPSFLMSCAKFHRLLTSILTSTVSVAAFQKLFSSLINKALNVSGPLQEY